MENTPVGRRPVTEEEQRRYLTAQTAAALGPVNMWFTGIALGNGHKPTEEQAWRHWIKSGAAERWRNEYQKQLNKERTKE